MLQQTTRGTRMLAGVAARAATPRASQRFLSRSCALQMPAGKSDMTQKDMDANKKKLDELEKKSHNGGAYKRPSTDELKKKGEDAQVEQHRPDDGVY
ncbi:Protein FMP16, mitochondrial [Lachancea thermotolerans]